MLCAIFYHTLKVRTQIVRARHSAVNICIHNKQIVVLCKLLAHPILQLNNKRESWNST